MIKQALREYLRGHRQLKALVKDRIFPQTVSSSTEKPYITFQRVGSDPMHHMTGPSTLANATFQFDAWALTAEVAENVGEALREALDGFCGEIDDVDIRAIFMVTEEDDFTPATDGSQNGDYRERRDFDIWYIRSVPVQPLSG